MVLDPEVRELAQILWNFHVVRDPLSAVDAIFVMGSNDLEVPRYAAELYQRGLAPLLIFSGGFGNFTAGVFDQTEAELFLEIARDAGVPDSAMLIESKSTNSGENIQFTKLLLQRQARQISSVIAVQKPIMGKRVLASMAKQWPEVRCLVTSQTVSFDEYESEHFSSHDIVHVMVGDFQRILRYPELGYQIALEVPEHVMHAYRLLVKLGFDGHIVK